MKRIFILPIIALILGTSYANAQNNDDSYKRCVLLEEFSTENCSICPHITKYVHQLMEDPEYNENVIVVTHHVGFYTDFLTVPGDEQLTWFYNSKKSSCPAFMFDRYPFFNVQDVDELIPTSVGLVNNLAKFKDLVDTRMAEKSHLALDVTAVYDDNSTLTVTVSGERDAEFSVENPLINVYLTESNIKAQHQKGLKKGEEYYHHYALREYNSVWGDEIKWDGDKFTYKCTLNVDKDYKQDDLQIIAFVSNSNPDDPTDCVIENARMITFDKALGIENAEMHKDLTRTEYYTLDGIKTNPNESGMYIQKNIFADGSVETKKIMK